MAVLAIAEVDAAVPTNCAVVPIACGSVRVSEARIWTARSALLTITNIPDTSGTSRARAGGGARGVNLRASRCLRAVTTFIPIETIRVALPTRRLPHLVFTVAPDTTHACDDVHLQQRRRRPVGNDGDTVIAVERGRVEAHRVPSGDRETLHV